MLTERGKQYMREHYPDRYGINGAEHEIEDPPTDDEPIDVDDHHVGEHNPGSDDDDATWWQNAVKTRARQFRLDREARQRVDNEMRPAVHYPPVRSLTAMLDEPDIVTRYRIDDVAPADARIMLSAQYKAGKSTLVGNLIRALVDGEPFLGHFTVNTTARAIVLIDDEMSENTLRSWLRAQNISNTSAVADVITLRGNVGAFNLLDENCFAAWVQRLHDLRCDYLIVDCVRPLLDALALDEHRDAGRFLVAFDTLLNEADIRDALLIHHMGHAGERARGDSRLQDWPDAIWRLVRDNDDPASPRYFTAYGRDVEVYEGRLGFDPATRRLTYAAGSRSDAKVEAACTAVMQLLADDAKANGPRRELSKNAIESELGGSGHSRQAIRDAISRAVKDGRIESYKARHNAQVCRIANPCEGCGLPVFDLDRKRHWSCGAVDEPDDEPDEDWLP